MKETRDTILQTGRQLNQVNFLQTQTHFAPTFGFDDYVASVDAFFFCKTKVYKKVLEKTIPLF